MRSDTDSEANMETSMIGTTNTVYNELHRRVSERILALRLDSTRTKTYIAMITGFSRSYLTKLERGQSIPNLHTLAVLAVYYGVPVEYFITGNGLTRRLTDPMTEFREGKARVQPKLSASVPR